MSESGVPDVMSRLQVAKFLGVSDVHLDTLDIPRIKAGRRVLYRRATVDEYLRSREAVKEKTPPDKKNKGADHGDE